MKVCLVNLFHLDPPRNGGLSRVARIVCDLTAQLALQNKLKVFFAVGAQFSGEFRDWLGNPGGNLIPVMPDAGMTPIFETIHPDLLISPLLSMRPISDWKEYEHIPHIVCVPDTLALDNPELFTSGEAESRRAGYSQLENSSVVVTISEDARNRLIRHLGLPPSKVQVIPLAGDLSTWFNPADGRTLISSPYILYPARNWPHKRHELLIQVMNKVSQERPDLHLVLTGWHDDDYISELAASYDLPRGKILDFGFVSNADMLSLYRNAEALMFVSEYEGFGMPVLEAMQLGCPVICAPLTSLPEVAGDAAIYVDSKNPEDWARAFLYDLPNQRSSLIRKGFQQARKFSWIQTRAHWLHLIGNHLPLTEDDPGAFTFSSPSLLLDELYVWVERYITAHNENEKKERVIHILKDHLDRIPYDMSALQAENGKLLIEVNQLQAEAELAQELNGQLIEKDRVIQALRDTLAYRLEISIQHYLITLYAGMHRLMNYLRDFSKDFYRRLCDCRRSNP